MERYNNTVQESNGDIVTTATVTVYLSSTGAVASIFKDDEITAINNPFTISDDNYNTDGAFWFKAANGLYDIKVNNGSDVWSYDESLYDLNNIKYDTLTYLKALSYGFGSVEVLGHTSLNDGGGGVFYWDSTSTATDNNGTIIKLTSVATGRYVRIYSGAVNVKWFGAKGDGTTDDSAAIQASIDLLTSGGTIFFPEGDYRVTKHSGINDKWGVKVELSNIKLNGDNAILRRQSTDISTYTLSYPIILLGKPDDNATELTNLEITGITFIGENARHSTSGSALMDGRQAIWVKNVNGLKIHKNTFNSIDSGAVYFQSPSSYDYENSAYYNTTKNHKVLITENEFNSDTHATAGRALIHTIVSRGVDNLIITNNSFTWCDVCVSSASTYDEYADKETDTYTDSDLAVAVQRTGKGLTVSGNTIYNSSEHCLYLNAMGIVCTSNSIVVDDITVCNTVQIQVRGRGITISNNTIVGVYGAINCGNGCMDVNVTGNVIQSIGDPSSGAIQIESTGISTYINNRSDYFGSYKPCKNIAITGNSVELPLTTQANGIAIRVYTDSSDSNYTNGQMINVSITGNTANNAKNAIYFRSPLLRQCIVKDNIFSGKAFNEANFGTTGSHDGAGNAASMTDSGASFTVNALIGYRIENTTDGSSGTITANTATNITATLSGGTDNDWDVSDAYFIIDEMDGSSAITIPTTQTANLREITLSGNNIYGFEYILKEISGTGSAATAFAPAGISSNSFRYIRYWDSAFFRSLSASEMFSNNVGRFFLDRTGWFSNTTVQNSMSDGTSNSEKKSTFQLVSSTDVRIYYDDSSNFKAL